MGILFTPPPDSGLLGNSQVEPGLLGLPRRQLLAQQMAHRVSQPAVQQPPLFSWQDLANAGLSMAPGSGEYMSARDSVNQGNAAAQAFQQGHYMDAAQKLGGSFAAGLGAIPIFGNVIRAFHGSPHLFDKFLMSKIGTGEGAQAYGHGLYFAESPEVAKDYLRLAGPDSTRIGGKIIGDVNASDAAKSLVNQAVFANQRGQRSLEDSIALYLKQHSYGTPDAPAFKEAADLLSQGADRGHFYTVDLNVNPEDLLHWDKPLSEQPEKVRKLLEQSDFGGDPIISAWKQNGAWPHISGQTLYRHLADGLTNGATAAGKHAEASQMLNALGIPGIQYLDQASRGAGQGTHNYVLFDDSLANIVK